MSAADSHTFELLSSGLPSLAAAATKECFLQWNLTDKIFNIKTFRVFGNLSRSSKQEDYEDLLKALLQSPEYHLHFSPIGEPVAPFTIRYAAAPATTTSMSYFERIRSSDVLLTPIGNIRGCFEETFDGVIVNDCLREMLVSP